MFVFCILSRFFFFTKLRIMTFQQDFFDFLNFHPVIIADSLRSGPRRHKPRRDFFSFKKGDKSPLYEIAFSDDGETQLRLLKAVISTNLKHLDGRVDFFNGSTVIKSQV